MNIKFTGDTSLESANVSKTSLYVIKYPCYSQVLCAPYQLSFSPGWYYIELYGASGGISGDGLGGKGGSVSGKLYFRETTKLYLFIGGRGLDQIESVLINGGYNGGGQSNYDRGSGGGATDLRVNEGDLNSRILVAGAGGGAHRARPTYNSSNGGDGGGLNGERGEIKDGYVSCYATQFGCIGSNVSEIFSGHFGYGNNYTDAGGGGSGYWGGGSSGRSGSSGGSSYYNGTSLYKVYKPATFTGVNEGNGYAIIVKLNIRICTKTLPSRYLNSYHLICILLTICDKNA